MRRQEEERRERRTQWRGKGGKGEGVKQEKRGGTGGQRRTEEGDRVVEWGQEEVEKKMKKKCIEGDNYIRE